MKSKKKNPRDLSKLVFQLSSWGSYLDETAELETLLAKKPAVLRLELVGVGEMPADTVLLIRSILLARPPKTRLITHARSSLQGAAVLVWLLGDQRLIREDARLCFRAAGPIENGESAESWQAPEPASEEELESPDYVRVLQLINEFLPVRELAGKSIELPTLRQFGLVDSDQLDGVLERLLNAREPRPASGSTTTPEPAESHPHPNSPRIHRAALPRPRRQ